MLDKQVAPLHCLDKTYMPEMRKIRLVVWQKQLTGLAGDQLIGLSKRCLPTNFKASNCSKSLLGMGVGDRFSFGCSLMLVSGHSSEGCSTCKESRDDILIVLMAKRDVFVMGPEQYAPRAEFTEYLAGRCAVLRHAKSDDCKPYLAQRSGKDPKGEEEGEVYHQAFHGRTLLHSEACHHC